MQYNTQKEKLLLPEYGRNIKIWWITVYPLKIRRRENDVPTP